MSKPIFIVRIPHVLREQEGVERFEELQRQLQAKLDDYHVLAIIDSAVDAVAFACFNADDAEQKKIDEIKQMISESLKSGKN